jgi:ketosteroid isomerase-like protein
MSEENVDRFLAATEAFNRRDLKGAVDGFDPNVVFVPGVAEMEGSVTGRDEVKAFMAGLHDLYEVFELRYTDVRDLGDQVLALGRAGTVARESGIEQEWTLAVVVTFRDGLATHWKDYGDRAQALEAAGLRE